MEEQNTTLEQQLAEAEERGYRRGLNERIEAKMKEPGTWEDPSQPAAAPKEPEGYEILANMRKSIWD